MFGAFYRLLCIGQRKRERGCLAAMPERQVCGDGITREITARVSIPAGRFYF